MLAPEDTLRPSADPVRPGEVRRAAQGDPVHPSPVRRPLRTDIQGLRAVAVLAVILYHAGVAGVPGGYVGVDVFFVISGFLITGQLLTLHGGPTRAGLATFYARRARRILPVALVVLAATVIAAFTLASPLRLQAILQDAIASALYVPNIRFAILQTDYLADAAASPFQHYWSLGVEEQFYLVWPVFILSLLLAARMRSRWGSVSRSGSLSRWVSRWLSRAPALGVVVMVLLSFALCVALSAAEPSWSFFLLPTRGWEFGVGALAALVGDRAIRLPRWLAGAGGWVGLGLIVGAVVFLTAETPYPGWATLAPVAGAALVILCAPGTPGWGPCRVLAVRPLQFVGLISYSLYLVHWPALVLTGERLGPLPPLLAFTVLAGAVPVAWALYRFVELPARDGALLTRTRHRAVLAGAVVVPAVLSLALVGAVPVVASVPLSSGRAVESSAVQELPSATAFVPSNVRPTLEGAARDTGELYAKGCQQSKGSAEVIRCAFGDADAPFTIALFGDSHAGRWFPALEAISEARGIRLETYTKSACRSVESSDHWDAAPNPTCSSWRGEVIAELAAAPPDLIVLANHLGLDPDPDRQRVRTKWTAATASSLERLPAESAVVVLADTPEFPSSPLHCLSVNLDDAADCPGSRAELIDEAIFSAESDATASAGAGFVDLTDYFCNARSCPPIIGDTLVYSDEHHLTATFTAQLAPALDAALGAYLPAMD